MTPDQRARNSSQKWLKISCQEMMRIAKKLEFDMSGMADEDQILAQKVITDLRQSAKRCAHHGLGQAVQDILPLSKET